MKKKILVLIMATAMVATVFTGCGGTTKTNKSDSQKANNADNAQGEEDRIEFEEPKVLIDEDLVKVELLSFYQEKVNWSTGEQLEKNISVKITNKSDRKFIINLRNIYIGDEAVNSVLKTGNEGPMPGKSGIYNYNIRKQGDSDNEALDSLEQLKDLEGTFEVLLYKEDGKTLDGNSKNEYPFKINENSADDNKEQSESGVFETDHVRLKGLYYDESYEAKNDASKKLLYVFYEAFTEDENLKISSKSCKISFEGTNTYDSEHVSVGTKTKNYYYGDYIKEVNIGESKLVLTTFEIPELEFQSTKNITLELYGISDSSDLKISTDDIIKCKSETQIAKKVDPEGYKKYVEGHKKAGKKVTDKVRNQLNGYYLTFFVNNTACKLEFIAPNKFELTALGMTNGGKYVVLKDYVQIRYTSGSKAKVDIPYTFKDGEIDLDTTLAFDVRSNE
ncbi:MAG: hypothetical protein E7280_04965 [Lachnospiraceae bacterium]|nr:hypothetical protein [Lachnospiraceae bacterium]